MFYHYAGGRLTSVDGLAPAEFAYDRAGNMTLDGYDDLEIKYNLLNLPSQITDQDDPAQYVVNRYSITGQKVSSLDQDGNGRIYAGSLVYDVQGAQIALESAPFRGGRFVAAQSASGASYALQYHVTDHLGSVRVVLDRDGNVLEQSDYYPFGKRWETAGSPASGNRYRYNGKEVAASRLLDYGARYYSPGLGRWLSAEPLADFFPSQSLYAMCFDNPIRFVDPFGLAPDDPGPTWGPGHWSGDGSFAIDGVYVRGKRNPSRFIPWNWDDYDEWLEGIDNSFQGAVGGGGYGGGGVGGGGSGGGGGGMPTDTGAYRYVNDLYGITDLPLYINNKIEALMRFEYFEGSGIANGITINHQKILSNGYFNQLDIRSLLIHESVHATMFRGDTAKYLAMSEAQREFWAYAEQLIDPYYNDLSPSLMLMISRRFNMWLWMWSLEDSFPN